MTAFEVESAQSPLLGIAEVPGDKSIGHRAAILGECSLMLVNPSWRCTSCVDFGDRKIPEVQQKHLGVSWFAVSRIAQAPDHHDLVAD